MGKRADQKMKFDIRDLGRRHWFGTVVGTERELYGELKRHLMSQIIEVIWNGNEGEVYVGGIRHVSNVTRSEVAA